MAVPLSVDLDLVVELTRDLIRFRSVNPPGDELPAAQYLAEKMKGLGLEAEVQEVAPNRANVIGRLKGTGTGHLVFTGHLDVVPPGEQPWQYDPFDPVQENGRIYGRGACDMKGGVAAIVAAMASLKRDNFQPSADIIAAITCGEEAGGVGAKAMVEWRSLEGSRYLVVGEPTELDVFVAEKGVFWVRVRAFGRTAHGSMPELGANAVSYMARLIPRLEAYPFDFEVNRLVGSPTLSVNLISGGNKTNVVPDYCEVELDMRTVPGQDHAQMLEIIRRTAADVANEMGTGIRTEAEHFSGKPALETPETDPLVQTLIQVVTGVRGEAPEVGGVPYGTDAAHLGPAFQIPMVICGPGGRDMLHQPNEFVEVEELAQGVAIYVELSRRLLGPS